VNKIDGLKIRQKYIDLFLALLPSQTAQEKIYLFRDFDFFNHKFRLDYLPLIYLYFFQQ